MAQALNEFDAQSSRELWDAIPDGWPTHEENPYAFKAYSLDHAKNYGLILWLDASIVPVSSLDPLWNKIEKDGYWIARNGWNNYEWTADSAYPDLFPGMKIEQARQVNKQIPHLVGAAFGLNTRTDTGQKFLRDYLHLAKSGAFRGPWKNIPDEPCAPPDVFGHRHDQTAMSVIAWRLGMKITDCPEVFSYPPPRKEAVLLAVGA
jgi:hypothetical protein